MAPTKRTKRQKLTSTSNKVYSGRTGRSEPARSYANRNQGKELIPPKSNAQKELFPSPRNAAKERLPQLLHPVIRSSIDIRTGRPLVPVVNHPRRPKSKAMAEVHAANLRQRHAKQVQDGITKRLQAMEMEPDHLVEDARFTTTVPYKLARLDLQVNASTSQHRKLEFSIAVGFWGFAPTFTPVKIFSLSSERFAEPKGLASLILANTDVKKAAKQIGVDLDQAAFVGFELRFPKGYRYTDYTQFDIFGRPRESLRSFKVVQSGERVLINTECAMQEFFWQTQHYASDEAGRVLIQVTGRIGRINESGYESFDVNWRNDVEKELMSEDKRQYLEKQSFVGNAERKTINERMSAIEERSRMAVQKAQASQQRMQQLTADQEPHTNDTSKNFKQAAQNLVISVDHDNLDEVELDIDIDLDLDLDFV